MEALDISTPAHQHGTSKKTTLQTLFTFQQRLQSFDLKKKMNKTRFLDPQVLYAAKFGKPHFEQQIHFQN